MTVHGSGPNRGTGRRIGISLACVPAAARPLAGPRSAFLLAGENRPGHWALDPEPRFDLDPVAMAALARAQAAYRDPDRPSEAERGGGPAPR